MALDRRRRVPLDRLDATALLDWYSPYDLNSRAPINTSHSWNNYVVLALNGYPVTSEELLEQGYIEWSSSEYRNRPRPRHRRISLDANFIILPPAEATRSYPIFNYLLNDEICSVRKISDLVHLSHWVEVMRPQIALSREPYVTQDELRLLTSSLDLRAGQLAAHGYFDRTGTVLPNRTPRLTVARGAGRDRDLTAISRGFTTPLGPALDPIRADQQQPEFSSPAATSLERSCQDQALNLPAREPAAGELLGSSASPPAQRPRLTSRRVIQPGSVVSTAPASAAGVGSSEAELSSRSPSPSSSDWVLATFGPPVLVQSESVEQFRDFLQLHLDALQPLDGFEALLVYETVDAEWEMRRLRNARKAAIQLGEETALLSALGYPPIITQSEGILRGEARTQVGLFRSNNPVVLEALNARLVEKGSSLTAVADNAYAMALQNLRSIEIMLLSCVTRREGALKSLQRRREGVTQRIKLLVKIQEGGEH
jgi:hypothetical protein